MRITVTEAVKARKRPGKRRNPNGNCNSNWIGSPSALEREGLVRKALGREDSKGDCSTGGMKLGNLNTRSGTKHFKRRQIRRRLLRKGQGRGQVERLLLHFVSLVASAVPTSTFVRKT